VDCENYNSNKHGASELSYLKDAGMIYFDDAVETIGIPVIKKW
jgi:hypothetical protein